MAYKPAPKRVKHGKLTEMQRACVDWYFHPEVKFNKIEAMRRAGYAHPEGYDDRLFKSPRVIEYMEQKRKRVEDKFELTEDWLIGRLVRMVTANEKLGQFKKVDEEGSPYWDFTGATAEDLALITELSVDAYTEGRGENAAKVKKVKVGTADEKAAVDALMRYMGLFNDKLHVKGEMSLVERLQRGRQRVKSDE